MRNPKSDIESDMGSAWTLQTYASSRSCRHYRRLNAYLRTSLLSDVPFRLFPQGPRFSRPCTTELQGSLTSLIARSAQRIRLAGLGATRSRREWRHAEPC